MNSCFIHEVVLKNFQNPQVLTCLKMTSVIFTAHLYYSYIVVDQKNIFIDISNSARNEPDPTRVHQRYSATHKYIWILKPLLLLVKLAVTFGHISCRCLHTYYKLSRVQFKLCLKFQSSLRQHVNKPLQKKKNTAILLKVWCGEKKRWKNPVVLVATMNMESNNTEITKYIRTVFPQIKAGSRIMAGETNNKKGCCKFSTTCSCKCFTIKALLINARGLFI